MPHQASYHDASLPEVSGQARVQHENGDSHGRFRDQVPVLGGIYLFTTNIKGISSMRLHRELGIGQKAAWFMLHRLRDAYENETRQFFGPAEVGETLIGGNRSNMSNRKRKKLREAGLGRGTDGKTAVAGVKDLDTNEVRARVFESTDKKTLHPFAKDNAGKKAAVYTDDATVYGSLPFAHESVKYSVSEHIRDMVHANVIESFWALMKRVMKCGYHKLLPENLQRYVNEFAGRHNARGFEAIDQMGKMVRGMEGRRLRCEALTADIGPHNGAQ